MKKIIIVGILVLLLAVVFSGCIGNDSGNDDKENDSNDSNSANENKDVNEDSGGTDDDGQKDETDDENLNDMFFESWESAEVGTYISHTVEGPEGQPHYQPITTIEGDAGSWLVWDYYSTEVTDWSIHFAEIINSDNGKYLSMTAVDDSNATPDLTVIHENVNIPLTESTTISFTAYGTGALFQNVSEFTEIYVLVMGIFYIIRPDDYLEYSSNRNRAIILGNGSHTRNLYDDYTNVLGKEYDGDEVITYVKLRVRYPGNAIFDDIMIKN